jgi:hypothetical protein
MKRLIGVLQADGTWVAAKTPTTILRDEGSFGIVQYKTRIIPGVGLCESILGVVEGEPYYKTC